MWEPRIPAGTDPVTGRTIQRSVTFRGSAGEAERYRRDLAAEYIARRSVTQAAPMLTVAELFDCWLLADHPWKPSTAIGYASNARLIAGDRKLAATRVVSLTPQAVPRRSVDGRLQARPPARSRCDFGCCAPRSGGPTTNGSSTTTRSGRCVDQVAPSLDGR